MTGWIPEVKLSLAAFDGPVGTTDWKGSGGKRTGINNFIYVPG